MFNGGINVGGTAALAGGWRAVTRAQDNSLLVAHGMATFVYGRHLIAKEAW